MSEHISIFDDLYSIREQISDGYFLILNNRIKNLIQENRYLRKTIARILPGQSITIQYTQLSDENDDEIEIEYIDDNSDIQQEIYEVIQQQCTCTTRWSFPNLIGINENLSDFFCYHSVERLQNCENFKKLMEKLPLLENLFRKIDLPFAEDGLYQEFVKHDFILIIQILLFLISNITDKMNKIIISFVMYDFHIKNLFFLQDNKKYAIKIFKKFEEFLIDRDFIDLALEYNINYIKWLEIFKKTISEE